VETKEDTLNSKFIREKKQKMSCTHKNNEKLTQVWFKM